MRSHRFAAVLLSILALPALSQTPGCVGPGAAFGVIAYECAGCTIKTENGRTTYSFLSEPMVTQVTSGSKLLPGDVIESVGGNPITTQEGADAFTSGRMNWAARDSSGRLRLRADTIALGRAGVRTDSGVDWARRGYADAVRGGGAARGDTALLRRLVSGALYRLRAMVSIRVRRSGQSVEIDNAFSPDCGGGRAGRGRGRGASPDPDFAGRPTSGPPEPQGTFGLAISCVGACSRHFAPDGSDYWQYKDFPTIAALRDGSPAGRTGLKVGDVVTKIDGLSILVDDGARRLGGAERAKSLHVTVLRDGREVGYLLSVR